MREISDFEKDIIFDIDVSIESLEGKNQEIIETIRKEKIKYSHNKKIIEIYKQRKNYLENIFENKEEEISEKDKKKTEKENRMLFPNRFG